MKRAFLVTALIVAAGGAGAAALWLRPQSGEPARKTGPLRVEIVTASADGAPPAGFSLRREDGQTLALAPSGGPGSVLSADGEKGQYAVVAPAGWDVVGTSGKPLFLPFEPGLPATTVPIGREYALYLIPPEGKPIREFEVQRELPGGKFEPSVLDERTIGADHRVVIRFKPENWVGPLRVTALFADETISKAERILLPGNSAPMGVQVKPGGVAPLEVRVFRPEDGRPADGVEMRVDCGLGKLRASASTTTDADGIARFAALPSMVPQLHIREATRALNERGLLLPAAVWRLTGEARCLSAHRSGAPLHVTVDVPAWNLGFVQVRPPGAASYAMLDAKTTGLRPGKADIELFVAPNSRCMVFVTSESAAGIASFEAKPGAYAEVAFEPLCQVRANVSAGGEYHSVRILCRRKEGDLEVLAQGWSVLAMAPGGVDFNLPTGIYRVTVLDGDREGASVPLTLEKPGAQAQVNVAAP